VIKRVSATVFLFAATTACSVLATVLFWWSPAAASEIAGVAAAGLAPDSVSWGFVAAALATGLSSLGAGIAVAGVGSAAIGAITEKPEMLGRSLIVVGLAEGIAIYGLIVSILILNRVM
jgi:V/A-type H+-transporting ATPase subunit K